MFLALCGVKHDDLTVGPVFLGRGLALHKPPRGGFLRGFKYEMHYLWVTGTLEGYWGSFPEWSLGIDLLVPQLLGLLEAAGLVELDLFSRAPTEKGSFLGVRELDTGRLVADRELPAELQELPYRYTTNERFTAARYDLATLQKEGWPERVSQIASSSLSFCEGILDSGEEGSRILSAASRLTASSVAEDRKEGLLDAATGLELLLGDAKSPISSHKLGDRLSLALKVDGDRRKAVMGDYSKAEGIKERVIRNDPAVSDKDHSWCRWKLRQLLKRVLIAEAWNLRQLGRPN